MRRVDLPEVELTSYYESYESEVNTAYLVHVIFLSHCGSSLDEVVVSDRVKAKREVVSSIQALHMYGVVHVTLGDRSGSGKERLLIFYLMSD